RSASRVYWRRGAKQIKGRSAAAGSPGLATQMVNWKDLTLDMVQAAIFTPEHAAFRSGKAVATILERFQDRFDGEMQVLPLPMEVPPEVHRVVLQSNDSRRRLAMAPARVD